MIGPTNRKNWLTFDGAPVSDTDYGLLFFFPHRCAIGDFRRFISISDNQPPHFCENWRNDWRQLQVNETTAFWDRCGRNPDSVLL